MKKYKLINPKRFIACIATAALVTATKALMIAFIRFTEWYLTTERYQLENKVKAGDEKAIEFYNRVYVANGRELFN